jgi:integrase
MCEPRMPEPLLDQAAQALRREGSPIMARGEGRLYQRPRSPFWWCEYYLRNRQYRQSTGKTDYKKAQKFLKDKLKEVHADQIGAKAFVTPKAERLTVPDLLNALVADYKLRSKLTPQVVSHLKPLRSYFGVARAVEVAAEDVDAFITHMLDEDKAVATINRSTQLLAQAFQLAVKRRHLSMIPAIRHLSESGNTREGFFAEWEFRAVVENLPEYLQDFARFGYLTGWRLGEIRSLRWAGVDHEAIRLRAEDSKNGCARTVPITGELVEIIRHRQIARQVKTGSGMMLADLVFHHGGHAIIDIRKSWATATRLAGVPGKLFHDLRRTAVRNMIRAGVAEKTAMDISGHKTRSMFDRYNIVNDADKRAALERTGDYLLTQRQSLESAKVTLLI